MFSTVQTFRRMQTAYTRFDGLRLSLSHYFGIFVCEHKSQRRSVNAHAHARIQLATTESHRTIEPYRHTHTHRRLPHNRFQSESRALLRVCLSFCWFWAMWMLCGERARARTRTRERVWAREQTERIDWAYRTLVRSDRIGPVATIFIFVCWQYTYDISCSVCFSIGFVLLLLFSFI